MQGEQRQSGFVNPYNFVRLWGKVPRSQPESHEYFVGNRGRIVCQITFKTPFFIPHPERRFQLPETSTIEMTDDQLPCWVRGKAMEAWEALKKRIKQAQQKIKGYKGCEGHEMLALLRDEQEKPFIPGSSLKGAFRTVAEALSNSCMSQLEFEWELMQKPNDPEVRISRVKRYYSYRLVRSPMGVGRVTRLADPSQDGEIVIGQKYRVFYNHPRSVINGPVPICRQQLQNAEDGDRVTAQIRTFHYQRMVRGRNLEIPTADLSQGQTHGILKITDTTEAKNSQRFIVLGNRTVNFDYETQLRYNRAIREGIEEDRTLPDFIQCKDPTTGNLVGYRRKRHELMIDDIVYFNVQNNQVLNMGPVELYRVLYKHSLDEILLRKHKEFLPCQKPENLCPACRLFGWVAPEADKEESTTALKGFIHFSPARWVSNSEPKTQWVTLQPLGQPKPSCWQFYLNCQNVGENAGYNDDKATIRGRKFYWHKPKAHANQPQSGADVNSIWDQRGGNGQPLADDQNKTVELLLPENAVFEFTVDFENLSDADLGLLLLTLQPNLLGEDTLNEAGFSSQLYHHFGMGKPLGLGSAEVKIVSLTLFKDCHRYRSLEESGEEQVKGEHLPEFARRFIIAFVRYAVEAQRGNIPVPSNDAKDDEWLKTFISMPPITDLLTMLDWKKAEDLPVQYPPGGDDETGGSQPNMKEYWEAFRWFAHKNQRNFLNKPKHMLKTPEEITKSSRQDGFPPRDLSQHGSSQSSHPPSRQQHPRQRPRGG
ncbi:TIGR03986 family type III CRISPR-associated RAMP protein [Thermocrinis sp.]